MQSPFFRLLFGRYRFLQYLCTRYGIELYLYSIFRQCVCHRIGEIGVVRRLRRVSGHDGFNVLVVEDGI